MSRFYWSIRILFAVSTTVPACTTAYSGTGMPGFHHPLLHHEPAVARPGYVGASSPERWLASARVTQRCTHAFSHPLLNRCEVWGRSASLAPRVPRENRPSPAEVKSFDDPLGARLAVARQARLLLARRAGGRGYAAGGRRYRRDCSGFVQAVYAAAGVPLEELMGGAAGSRGVAGMYLLAREQGLVHRRKVPAIGDLVFFSNTYDRNRDGSPNDELTHIGIVEHVDPDGTISVIHHVRRGVLRYRMSRFHPDVRRDPQTRKVYNHFLRFGSGDSPGGAKKLTGQLFHSFATLIK